MKQGKRWLALLLTLATLLSALSVTAWAVDIGETDETEGSAEVVYIDPMYRGLIDERDLARPSERRRVRANAPSSGVTSCASVEEAAKVLRTQTKNRVETISLGLRITGEVSGELARDIYSRALTHTGVPTEGDYIWRHCAGYQCDISWYQSGTTQNVTLTYYFIYLSTAKQEQAVDAAVASLLRRLDLSGDDYHKLKSIYEYICSTTSYDWDSASGKKGNDMTAWTAYGALIDHSAVCQGYASLLYRLALEAGLDARIISGIGAGGRHAWNIVRVNGVYYNVDVTWDTGISNVQYASYFLKGSSDFFDHTPDAECAPAAMGYRISERSYGTPKELTTPALPTLTTAANGIIINWSKVSGAEKYRVFRKTGSGSWVRLGDTAGTSWTDRTAEKGKTYSYTICCVSKDGKTETSDYNKTGRSVLFYLATPSITKLQSAASGVIINWNKVAGAQKYRVFRKTAGGGWERLGDASGTSWTDRTAQKGTTYSYTVRCVSADGKTYTSSFNSTGWSVKHGTAEPTNLKTPAITNLQNASGGIIINWGKVDGATRYRVFRRVGNGSWERVADVTDTRAVDRTAQKGVTYTYTVRCVTSDGKTYTSSFDSTGKTVTRK